MEDKNTEGLLKKIHKIKNEVGKISKDSKNPFFKSSYTDINSLLEQIEPLLEKEGLILLQPIRDNQVYSEVIDLETGNSMFSALTLPEITDPQKIGSAITYYRRYTLTSLFALQSEDDDGNLASDRKTVKMVTMKQGKYLQSLGMKTEDIKKLTMEEAADKISELKEE